MKPKGRWNMFHMIELVVFQLIELVIYQVQLRISLERRMHSGNFGLEYSMYCSREGVWWFYLVAIFWLILYYDFLRIILQLWWLIYPLGCVFVIWFPGMWDWICNIPMFVKFWKFVPRNIICTWFLLLLFSCLKDGNLTFSWE